MPLVTVKALEGRTIVQKRGLVKDITEAVVKNFKVEPESVTIDIIEFSRDNLAEAGKLFVDRQLFGSKKALRLQSVLTERSYDFGEGGVELVYQQCEQSIQRITLMISRMIGGISKAENRITGRLAPATPAIKAIILPATI